VECETQTDPGRSSEGEEPDAGRKKPGAPSGALRNLQKGEGSLQDGDQGGEDRGAPEALSLGSPEDPWGLAYKLITSKKRGAATPWTTIQDNEGNWAGNRTKTAIALIRKYFPEDDPGADTAENRESRAKSPEWNDDQAREITQQELRRTIQEKPKKKAPGIDGFPSAGLEYLFEAIGRDMLEVFNRCLKEGRFARVWKQAEIGWIEKVYDKILATRLTYHLEVKGRLSDKQFGFRKGRGTIEAIDKAVESLKKAKTESKHAIMVALDIKNAFNSACCSREAAVRGTWGGPSRTFCRIAASLQKE
jgi:hypothetical protein